MKAVWDKPASRWKDAPAWCVGSTNNIVLCCVTIVEERGRERAVCVFTMAVRAKKRGRERVCVLVKVRRG